MAKEEAMISNMCCVTCLIALTALTGISAGGSAVHKPEKFFSRPLGEERAIRWQLQHLNTSAINTALAFGPYHDLTTRTAAEPGVQQQNILVSPAGLALALAQLSRVPGFEIRAQALEAMGLAANSTEQSVEATIYALTDLQQSLFLQGGGAGAGAQRADGAAGTATESGSTAGVETRENHGNTSVDSGLVGRPGPDVLHSVDSNGTDNREEEFWAVRGLNTGSEAPGSGGELRMWSSLHVDGEPSLNYETFLSSPLHNASSAFNNMSFPTLLKDLQSSDKLVLNNSVYFKGHQPFERRHTVLRSFHLNATASVEVAMMFRDDSADIKMLYDTNCSATVVRLAHSERVASLLLLPKAELQPLESCLSDSRMSFWLSNLKPGRAEIRFPKFQLRKSYSFESLLRSSALSFRFPADVSGISPNTTLKLFKARHQAALEVEESESEDANRSDIKLDFSVPPRITFDRPFVLIIYDDVTGLILLIGKILDPTDA